jgi:NADPH2:quinone reductase
MRAVRVHAPGPSSSLVLDEIAVAPPGPGEVRVKHTAIGVDFLDIYHRSGLYPLPMPAGLGTEAAGVVVAAGAGVTHLQPGARVAYVWKQPGAYAEERNVPALALREIPDGVADDVAASLMVKGLTAEFLLRRTFRVDAGHTIVIHAAAGGVGQLVCAWARALGARVVGIVSTEEKARVALQAGAHHVLINAAGAVPSNLAARVAELCADGVDVVYDSVGKDTFMESMAMLKPRGLLVLFGQASGPVGPFDPSLLARKGSLFLTRPTLFDYIADPGEYRAAADALFDVIKRGVVVPSVTARYPLADAKRAHDDLEGRKTTGAIVLVP